MSAQYIQFSIAALVALLVSGELALSLPVGGMAPDLLILVVAAFAMGQRPRAAAAFGFVAGLVRDLLLSTPAGLGAFAYSTTAYAVALLSVSRSVWAQVAVMVGATFLSQLTFGLGAIMLTPNVDASPLPRVVLLTTAYNALISPLLLPVLRRLPRAETGGKTSMGRVSPT